MRSRQPSPWRNAHAGRRSHVHTRATSTGILGGFFQRASHGERLGQQSTIEPVRRKGGKHQSCGHQRPEL